MMLIYIYYEQHIYKKTTLLYNERFVYFRLLNDTIIGGNFLYRKKNVNVIILLLVCLLIIIIINVVLHVRIYIVYTSGVGPIFIIFLIIFLIVLLYLKG
jgi:hypothetical protein